MWDSRPARPCLDHSLARAARSPARAGRTRAGMLHSPAGAAQVTTTARSSAEAAPPVSAR